MVFWPLLWPPRGTGAVVEKFPPRFHRPDSGCRMMSEGLAPPQGYWLGFDTGGTFTDAVLLAGGEHVIASAKSLTTPWDLAIGLGGALRAVLAMLPEGARRDQISLVSVSTTLATNAVVENRFSPICTL